MTTSISNVEQFWETLYRSAYADAERHLTPAVLSERLAQLEDMFRCRDHLAVTEMPIDDLKGKKVLEIGSGAGGHSALFAKHGAIVTSIDLSAGRAAATQQKFDLLGDAGGDCHALQSNAESLPFASESFDIVYSNGVLHHTPDTEKAVTEIFRVLKPGGQIAIMLYCKSSFHYWFNMWFCVGVLCGKLLTGANWLGRATEWIGDRSAQTAVNPITRCYYKRDIEKLFGRYDDLSIRKTEFYFYLIPKIGRFYRRWQIKRYGVHPGGIIVYGSPWPIWSPVEKWLGERMGWSWNISARKPDQNRPRT